MTMALSSFIIITVKISIKNLYSCLSSSINPWYKMILLGLFTDHRNAQQITSYKKKTKQILNKLTSPIHNQENIANKIAHNNP